MDQNHSDKPEGAPACAQNADADAPLGGAGPECRNSPRRKLAAVTRLLRGKPLETVARELNVTVARLSEWRDRALVGAEAAMKERERDNPPQH
ncbi:helix-turn-helix domain-containing protein [Belnapia moabensis]|uniref:helix-turn-helix domain-containing protein n=1 Tax=Belnapia moabensis TaxID=365533 RepID=UPI0005BC80DC|nr:helix-turn-helix domain-containing protein [Belnapia moabensis]